MKYNNKKDIAIIGLSARFPDATNVEQFWKNVANGHCSIRRFTREELILAGENEAIIDSKSYIGVCAVLDNIDQFDADFFGFSSDIAKIMDPQFRIFFEVAWEALEESGWAGRRGDLRIGVFTASGTNLHNNKLTNNYFTNNVVTDSQALKKLDPIMVRTLSEKDHMAMQLSYRLNLTGPSMSVSTACSSSLVAVHIAISSLLNNECDCALVGAAAIHIPHVSGYQYHKDGILSANGECRPFDASAVGTVGGNGVGVVILKPLSAAIGDNDRIDAVIKGIAVNNDGSRKVSYTSPSVDGQKETVAKAIENSGFDVNCIGLIEAHGTGTPMGDAIEIGALAQVFKSKGKLQSSPSKTVVVGSVKSNIGHLDSAAGMASLIKAVLSIKHGVKPATANFSKPNPLINLHRTPFSILQKSEQWNIEIEKRVVLVGAVAAGGTNTHLILSGWKNDKRLQRKDIKLPNSYYMLFISAKTFESLNRMIEQFTQFFSTTGCTLADICYSSAVNREHFNKRCVVIGKSKEKMQDDLVKCRKDIFSENIIRGGVGSLSDKKNISNKTIDSFMGLGIWKERLHCIEIANLYCRGEAINFPALYCNSTLRPVSLPTYSFESNSYWIP